MPATAVPVPLAVAPLGPDDELPATLIVGLACPACRHLLTLPASWDTATVTLSHATALRQPLTKTLVKGSTIVAGAGGTYVATSAIGTALRPASGYTLTVDLWNGGASGVLAAEKQQTVALVGGTNAITVTLGLVPALSLTGFSPSSGIPGDGVTLTGQGFSVLASNDKPSLGGVAATVNTAAATTVGTRVPDVGPGSYTWTMQVGSSTASHAGFTVPGTIGAIQNWITLASHQTNPAIAYGNGEYLAAWTDNQGSPNNHIYGAMISPSTGAVVGSYIPIDTNAGTNQDDAAIAYNPGTNQFLVCFWDNGGAGNVYGQLVNANGTLAGGRLTIAASAGTQTRPQVTFDATGNEYLVAWMDTRLGTPDIFAQRLDPAGAPLGGNFAVYSGAGNQDNPSVCYSPANNLFLVTYDDDQGGGRNIRGRLVNPDGSLGTGPFTINVPDGKHYLTPAAAFDSTTHNFLVVWADNDGPKPIQGQLVGPTGALVGSLLTLSGTTDIARTAPRLAYETYRSKFVVVWNANDSGTNWDIDGQFVNDDGTFWGNNFPGVVTNGTQTNCDVAVDPAASSGMIAYQDASNGNNVYGQMVR